MTNSELAAQIIANVGGEENISALTHCATRLRFNLKDNNKANMDVLKNLEGVLTAQIKSGQTQVVIGAKVNAIFDEVSAQVHITEGTESVDVQEKPKGKISALVETISGIFAPTLPVLIGCGMFKAIVSLLTNLNLASADSGFMIVLTMIGDLIFYFFPFFLAVSAAEKFKVSKYMALALAAGYMYPTIMDGAAAASETGVTALSFLGLPILYVNYKSTVIPIILSVWVLSLIYKRIDKLVPDSLKILLTSMLVMFIMIPLELIVLGPIGSYAGTYIAQFMDWFYNVGGIFAAALLGGTRSLLTMMGMHYALAPLQIQQIAETGVSTLLVSALTANFAQAGAALGCALAIKNRQEKSVAFSAALSAVLGITEPAMYGVNLKYKKPFVFAMISSAIAAAFLSVFHAGAMAYAPPGLFTIITYQADSFVFIILGAALSFGLAGVLSFMFGVERKTSVNAVTESASAQAQNTPAPAAASAAGTGAKVLEICSPIAGEIKPLSEVPDAAFASGAMGKGVGILPAEGKVYAPFDGTVEVLFPTLHAVGLSSDSGVEALIHVGTDTVELGGKYFTAHVKQGDRVKKGQLLLEFDKDAIADQYSILTPVLISNSDQFASVETMTGQNASLNDPILKLESA